MARYFFHMQTETRTTDTDGQEYSSPPEARAEAIQTCGQMMKDAPDGFWGSRPWSVVVTDAVGLILWEITMDGYAAPAVGQAAA